MRTTLDLPEPLINEGLRLTNIKTKTELITLALREMIRKYKLAKIKNYKGKINLDLDLDVLRKRR